MKKFGKLLEGMSNEEREEFLGEVGKMVRGLVVASLASD